MPLVGIALLWFAYTLEWYGWLTYEFAYGIQAPGLNTTPAPGQPAGSASPPTKGPGLTTLIVPSERGKVLNALSILSQKQNAAVTNTTSANSTTTTGGNTGGSSVLV